jgi:uncharacterized membrane protein YphA (DoxX/SURF4 family)
MTIRTKNKLLWVLQAVLAILFMFAGVTKLAADPVQLAAQAHMSATLLQVVSVFEILGAIGLIVPAVTGIMPWLTPLAASGLVVIMIGAVTMTVMSPDQSPLLAIFPFIVGVLLIVVAAGRRKVPPGSGSPASAHA